MELRIWIGTDTDDGVETPQTAEQVQQTFEELDALGAAIQLAHPLARLEYEVSE